jgi:para-nitrobenzyl esterase
MKRLLGIFAVVAVLLSAAAITEPVRVEGGLVTGTPAWGWGIRLFRGIPYAAPPVGNLRWRPPQTVVPWKGVLVADRFSAACMQLPRPQDNIGWRDGMTPISEDCLYLNVWTPAKAVTDRLPVMVWIHGGGFREGSGAETAWAPDNIAKKGVVVVNFNYRLNVFGFFSHPDLTRESEHHASGNYAILDQIAALRWVRNNIAQFGGDPNNITIFGQSAGAASVAAHLASPLSKGLFRRAIGQSGGLGGRTSLTEAEAAGRKFAESLGAHSIAELRAKSAAEIQNAKNLPRGGTIVDGWVLPEDAESIFEHGKQNDVPLIAGSTADDGPGAGPPVKAAEAAKYAKETFGALADEYLKLYPAGNDAQAKKSSHDVLRDRSLYSAKRWVTLQTKTGKSPVYWYLFTHVPPVPPDAKFDGKTPAEVGAYHGADNIYTFDNLRAKDWPWKELDWKLGYLVSSIWVQFAKTGNPNGPGLPEWPSYKPDTQLLLNIGDAPHAEPGPYKAQLSFFEKVGEQQRVPPATRSR